MTKFDSTLWHLNQEKKFDIIRGSWKGDLCWPLWKKETHSHLHGIIRLFAGVILYPGNNSKITVIWGQSSSLKPPLPNRSIKQFILPSGIWVLLLFIVQFVLKRICISVSINSSPQHRPWHRLHLDPSRVRGRSKINYVSRPVPNTWGHCTFHAGLNLVHRDLIWRAPTMWPARGFWNPRRLGEQGEHAGEPAPTSANRANFTIKNSCNRDKLYICIWIMPLWNL